MLNAVVSNLPVPTVLPFNVNEPVMFNEPVNLCVSSSVLPNVDEPLEKLVVKYVIEFDTIYCCAIKLPVTVKEPVTSVFEPN